MRFLKSPVIVHHYFPAASAENSRFAKKSCNCTLLFLLIFFICSCQKESRSDEVLLSYSGKCAFSASFHNDSTQQQVLTVGFDCAYAKYLPVKLPEGSYTVYAYTNDFKDSLQPIKFVKSYHWQELSFDW